MKKRDKFNADTIDITNKEHDDEPIALINATAMWGLMRGEKDLGRVCVDFKLDNTMRPYLLLAGAEAMESAIHELVVSLTQQVEDEDEDDEDDDDEEGTDDV